MKKRNDAYDKGYQQAAKEIDTMAKLKNKKRRLKRYIKKRKRAWRFCQLFNKRSSRFIAGYKQAYIDMAKSVPEE
ncbi:hypothetical protein [Staphylococcus debuckii]|uniref:hypothetical protein n=1 Tax=Staphylococcus debuckii TaxID=2044912 RepID=UPI000F43005F|nr:hypothetical protein [Staphylococcus debuckii]AYU54859.1 hypothetical protein CNQ82_05215 [Staphylococcus debuckii]